MSIDNPTMFERELITEMKANIKDVTLKRHYHPEDVTNDDFLEVTDALVSFMRKWPGPQEETIEVIAIVTALIILESQGEFGDDVPQFPPHLH
jgi:hypothetical protein